MMPSDVTPILIPECHGHWIGGAWVAPNSQTYLPSINPATGQVWARIADGNESDVDRAVESAAAAFVAWSARSPRVRGQLMIKLADAVETHADELAKIESRDNGKLLRETGPLVSYLAEYFRYAGEMADKIFGAVIPSDKADTFAYVIREPMGVAALVTPWNSPLFLLATKLPAALVAGNTVVVKPSEHASVSTLALVRVLESAGLPPGVVNVVTGTGIHVGAPLARHEKVSKVAFTGGTDAARSIIEGSSANMAKLTLELGGKSPQLVFADADLENAVNGIVAGVFAASGQSCVSGSRVYVQEEVYEQFVDLLVERTSQMRLGDPLDPATDMGPLALEQQLQRVENLVEHAVQDGGTVLLGGRRSTNADGQNAGWYFPPTIITGLPETSVAQKQEIFGPVVSVNSFESEQEAVERANDTKFGLASGIWTSDVARAHRLIPLIRAGLVWVNTYRLSSPSIPFGGRGESGYGIEGGVDGICEFTQSKSVVINTSPHGVGDPLRMR